MSHFAGRFQMKRLLASRSGREAVLAEDRDLQRDIYWDRPDSTGVENANDDELLAAWTRAYATIDHPALATLLEVYTDRGFHVIVEERKGPLLSDQIARGMLDSHEVLAWLGVLGEALELLHGTGIAHGHVSTESVRLTPRGPVLLRPVPGADDHAKDAQGFQQLTSRLLALTWGSKGSPTLMEVLPEDAPLRDSVAHIAIAKDRATPQIVQIAKSEALPRRRDSALGRLKTRKMQNTLLVCAALVILVLLLLGKRAQTHHESDSSDSTAHVPGAQPASVISAGRPPSVSPRPAHPAVSH